MISSDALANRIGAHPHSGGTRFRVWAPKAHQVHLHLSDRVIEMNHEDRDYFFADVASAKPGEHYRFQLDDHPLLPDPASRFQPEGIHGPSEIVSEDFRWNDSHWKGVSREELTLYELHVGTYTQEGTFEAIIPHLNRIYDLGITAIELMPVSQFSGRKNWGYDGVFPFAVQNTYGGPTGLKRLIDACHTRGIAVILDVVYNHLGPEGNILPRFAPYFQDRYRTPWGDALNFDGPFSDEVKRYFCQTLVQWLDEFHLDGLRLDAIHAILDESQHRFLEYLGEIKHSIETRSGRTLHLIAESDANDPKVLQSRETGGLELDLQWNDDFHHSLHTILTEEKDGYYTDFGRVEDLAQAYRHGTVYRDRYSNYRQCSRGRAFDHLRRNRLVVYSQNHDQIGNRAHGERLLRLVGERKQRLAAACTFLSPFTPLIFMGEEWGETHPFLYFIDHADPTLVQAVIEGRKREFQLSHLDPPNPALDETFEQSQVHPERLNTPEGKKYFEEYRSLIRLSKWIRRERYFEPENLNVSHLKDEKVIQLTVLNHPLIALFSFNSQSVSWAVPRNTSYHVLYSTDWTEKLGTELILPPDSAILLQGEKS